MKKDNRKESQRTAIEFAILNGIEEYNRRQEQEAASGGAKMTRAAGQKSAQTQKNAQAQKNGQTQKSAQAQKSAGRGSAQGQRSAEKGGGAREKDAAARTVRVSLGEQRTAEAMAEAGFEKKRKSRAKGKGTKLISPAPSSEAEKSAAKGAPAAKNGRKTSEKGAENGAKGAKREGGKPSAEVALRPAEAEKQGKKGKKKPIKVLFLGGVGEIGKNMTAIEYGNDIIVIDAGVIFPTEELPGVDLVFPDIGYLAANKRKIRGVFLTHGHEDHIGGVPYLMKELLPETPVYGTKLTLALVDNKLREHRLNNVTERTVKPGDRIKAGVFAVNCVNVNHSIAGALAFAVETPYGIIFHSGDFKIDLTPVAGSPIDLAEIAEYGKRGVLLYLGESTNIERPGFTMSEKVVGTTLEHLFAENADRRIIIATFASNVHRLQQIIDIAVKFRRKVALSGRSMFNVVEAAAKIGEITIPEGVLVDVEKAKNYFDRELVIVSTGTQGEPMSALTRMASGEFNKVTVGANDTIIISASLIPGNERMLYRVINNLFKLGADVVYESLEKIHVSGHACQEEHKIMHALLKPKFFIPVHGEYRHLKRHVLLAQEMGLPAAQTFIPEIGSCVELTDDSLRAGENIPAGARLIDGEGSEDLATGEAVKDRIRMSGEGLFIIAVAVSDGVVVGEPVIESRGFVYAEGRDFGREIKSAVEKAIATSGPGGAEELAANIRRAVKTYIYKKTKQSPMIVPIVQEL